MQGGVDLFLIFETLVVRTFTTGVFPQRLCCIEFGAVWRQVENLNPLSVFLEPFPDFLTLVIGRIVLDVVHRTIFLKHFGAGIFQEIHVGRDVEDFVHVVNELRRYDVDTAENLYRFSLPRHRH